MRIFDDLRAERDARRQRQMQFYPSVTGGPRRAEGDPGPATKDNFDWMDELHDDPRRCQCRHWAPVEGQEGHHPCCRKVTGR